MGDTGDLNVVALPGGLPGLLITAWRKPVEPYMKTCAETCDRPFAELTMPDVLAWVLVLGYAAVTGMVLGHLAGNILAAALRGPARAG